MANFKLKKSKHPSSIESVLNSKRSVNDSALKSNFKISFQYLDTTQKFGSSFKDWQSCGLLSNMLDTLKGFCARPLLEQIDGDKFCIYGDFPSVDKTKFTYPQNVPEDANWARIHVNGPAVIVGHVVSDTFYIVFLDKTHKFFLTKRVTGK